MRSQYKIQPWICVFVKFLRLSLFLVNFSLINVQKIVGWPLLILLPLSFFVGVWEGGSILAGSCATFSCGRVQPSILVVG